jgi:hypothetical protein
MRLNFLTGLSWFALTTDTPILFVGMSTSKMR